MNNSSILLGCDKIIITPPFPTELAGFAFRKGEFENVHSDLWAKSNYFVFPSGEEIILICADLIWFEYKLTEKIKSNIRNKLSKPHLEIIFHATHTHYAPQVNPNISPCIGEYNEEYVTFLEEQLLTLCENSIQNAESVTANLHLGQSSIPINRRVLENGIAQMKPNPHGQKDNTLSTIVFQTTQQKIKAILIHLACHPTTSAENRVSAEFMTNAVEGLSAEYSEKPVISVLQGFSGDTRINVSKQGEFYRGLLDKESKSYQEIFKQEIRQTLQTKGTDIKFNTTLQYSTMSAKLPLSKSPDHRTFKAENEVQEYWHKFFETKTLSDIIESKLWYWKLAENLSFLFSDGEVVTEYNRYAKEICNHHILTCGITNGITSYIPIASQIPEKGLETYDSIFFFMLPHVYAPTVEGAFKSAIKQIILS